MTANENESLGVRKAPANLDIRGKMTGTFWKFRLKIARTLCIMEVNKGVVGTLCGAVNRLRVSSGRV